MRCTLTPVAGKQYTDAKQVVADFGMGADFVLNDSESEYHGHKANRTQLLEEGYTEFTFLYGPENRQKHTMRFQRDPNQFWEKGKGGEETSAGDPERTS